MKRQHPHDEQEHQQQHSAFLVPLDTIDATYLPRVGGKAVHLGELLRAGFSVPRGFCVTTDAYKCMSISDEIKQLLTEWASIAPTDLTRRATLAAHLHTAFLHTPMPESIVDAVTQAYHRLGHGGDLAVAVRSSATAEDLPRASFAGQQETYLNRIGIESVLEAIQRCWASLWADRAVAYRDTFLRGPQAVHMAVVIQQMIEAEVAGVLFTANPLTGKRRECLIDANPGLGEAVVSGATDPDHFVVDTLTGTIVERRLGRNQIIVHAAPGGGTATRPNDAMQQHACLSDGEVQRLATLGGTVEAVLGVPQDIEWAMDTDEQLFLLQTRPITTLFPLPTDAPTTDEQLRVYLSFNMQQGTSRPFTPMGISAVRLLAGSLSTLFGPGTSARERLSGPSFVTEAASRVFLDVTAALRTAIGRRLLIHAMAEAEAQAAASFQHVVADPRLALQRIPPWSFLRAVTRLLMRTRLPFRLVQVVLSPQGAQARLQRLVKTLHDEGSMDENTAAHLRLSATKHLLHEQVLRVMTTASPVMLAGMLTLALARALLGKRATEEELQIILRGLPANPTTAMNLHLWQLAEVGRRDPTMLPQLQQTSAEDLTRHYQSGSLPSSFRQELEHFLEQYGHRSISELDLGMPRWSEDPTYLFGLLKSYLQLQAPFQTPEAQYRRAASEAEAMVRTLTQRARERSWLHSVLVGFFLRRARLLAGQREMPRFCLALLLAEARKHLLVVGDALVASGGLEQAEDIFFLTFPEAHHALEGRDLRDTVRERCADVAHEVARRHVPLVLLSDGTEPLIEPEPVGETPDMLRGIPASPGLVTARARVILDPHGADIEQGEILVAPSTDPGWTPLFFKAGGLVMETGGVMAHGAIVAREYGIPAIVGVRGATVRLKTGRSLTVNGTTGTIGLPPGEASVRAPSELS